MIHSNSEGDIYIEEMPLLLVHLREEEKGADARLSEVLSYALDGYAYETATEISTFEDYVNRWRCLEKTQNRKNPVQGRILFAVPLGTSGINLELYRLIRFLREHPEFSPRALPLSFSLWDFSLRDGPPSHELTLFPPVHGADGFYIAGFVKAGTGDTRMR